jgi:hypothetical protein
MSQPHVVIHNTNVQKNSGCFSGCGTVFAVLLLIGLAVEYWYIAVPLAVVGAGLAIWNHNREQKLEQGSPAQAPAAANRVVAPVAAATAAATVCANCGERDVKSAFCPSCGLAQTATCAGCGRTGLQSSYCPGCGSATYIPPPPS